jgi:hypothetical protein
MGRCICPDCPCHQTSDSPADPGVSEIPKAGQQRTALKPMVTEEAERAGKVA